MFPSRSSWTRTKSPPVSPVHSLPAVPPRYRFHLAASRPMVAESSSTCSPGPYAREPTGPYGRVRAGPPSTGTARAQVRRSEAWPCVLMASTSPSGVQPRTEVRASPQ